MPGSAFKMMSPLHVLQARIQMWPQVVLNNMAPHSLVGERMERSIQTIIRSDEGITPRQLLNILGRETYVIASVGTSNFADLYQ